MRWTIHALNSWYMSSVGEPAFDRLFLNKEIATMAPELAEELVNLELLER
jgi:hypothetical protein